MPFAEGSLVERQLFADCLVSTESRALVHLFFAEREASKILGVQKGTPALESAALLSSARGRWAVALR